MRDFFKEDEYGDSPFGLTICALAMVGFIFGLPWLVYFGLRGF